jgi:hypothetical protein
MGGHVRGGDADVLGGGEPAGESAPGDWPSSTGMLVRY